VGGTGGVERRRLAATAHAAVGGPGGVERRRLAATAHAAVGGPGGVERPRLAATAHAAVGGPWAGAAAGGHCLAGLLAVVALSLTVAAAETPAATAVVEAAPAAAPAASAPAAVPAPPAYSAWYRFEAPEQLGRSTGPTPWPALAHEVEWVPEGAGRWGSALRLPGTAGAGFYLPNPAAFFGAKASAGTVALWAKAAGPAADRPAILFDFMVSTGNTLVDGHQVVLFTQGKDLVTWPALSRRLSIPDPLAGGQWVHLALAWDAGTGAVLYVDGRRAAEAAGAFEPVPLSADWPGRIGCHTVGGGFPWAGAVDELRLFNRALTDTEVAALCSLDPTLPFLDARLDGDTVVLANAGSGPLSVALDRWLPARHLEPPWYGYLPIGWNTTAWTAGVCPTEPVGEPRQLAAGERTTVALALPLDAWGPTTTRLLVGVGLACQELPLRPSPRAWFGGRAQGPLYGRLDRAGLRFDCERSLPAVFPMGRELVVPVRVTNDLGRDLDLTATATLAGRGSGVQARAVLPLTLRDGASQRAELRFRVPMGLGRFEVRVTVPAGNGEAVVWRLPVYGTDPDRAARLAAVGAATVRPPDDMEVLKRMASDGVTFVRLGGKADGASLRHNLEAVMSLGMKAWLIPAFSYAEVCADPARRAAMQERALDLGTALRDNRAVINQSMAGEGLSAPPCYCAACNTAFRAALQTRYGSLRGLNQAWGATYADWELVEQLGSPSDVDMAAERLKMMQVALELPADNTQRWIRLFEVDRPRAMDWRRWHDALLLSWYRDFAAAFHRSNGGTVPLGEQPCWANFKTHVFFPLAEVADMGGIDLYLPGEMKTTLGYAAELFLNFDLNASLYHNAGKPVMVHEMYVQDLSPEGLAEAQGWWLAGRGYNLTTFFTYDYYYEGQRAGLPLVFGMVDKEGKAYPSYASFKRFSADFFTFAARGQPARLRRVEPRVGVFLGDDMSLANILETGGATWEADGVKGHNGSYWLTERNGHAVEFVNAATFANLDRESVLVVPWCHVLAEQSVEQILSFARHGGTVLIDGPFAQVDPQYRPYPICPGGGAAAALGVTLGGYERGAAVVVLPDGGEVQAFGKARGVVLTGRATVLCRDREGQPAVVTAPLGRGRVVWCLSALGPVHRGRAPDPRALAFWGGLLGEAGVKPWWRFVGSGPAPVAEAAPLFDLSARIRGDRELLVFATSFFGPVKGELQVDLPNPLFAVKDALSGQPLPVTWRGNTVSFPLELPAFGTRVLRLDAAGEKSQPLAGW
jgi:hypothetical protein